MLTYPYQVSLFLLALYPQLFSLQWLNYLAGTELDVLKWSWHFKPWTTLHYLHISSLGFAFEPEIYFAQDMGFGWAYAFLSFWFSFGSHRPFGWYLNWLIPHRIFDTTRCNNDMFEPIETSFFVRLIYLVHVLPEILFFFFFIYSSHRSLCSTFLSTVLFEMMRYQQAEMA